MYWINRKDNYFQMANSNLNNMWHQAADFHLRHGQPSTAAKSLEELIKNDPSDKRAIAQLAIAYAQVNVVYLSRLCL